MASFADLPQRLADSPPDRMEFKLHLTSLLYNARHRLSDIQLFHESPMDLLPPIVDAILPCLEVTPELKQIVKECQLPYTFVDRVHALVSAGSAQFWSNPSAKRREGGSAVRTPSNMSNETLRHLAIMYVNKMDKKRKSEEEE